MYVEFNAKKINRMLQDFYNATGIDMDLLKADFTPATGHRMHNNSYCPLVQSSAAGKQACHHSDARLFETCAATGQMQMHICHAGLVDVAIPIVYDDSILGYIIFGRMKPNRDFSVLEDYLSQLGVDTDAAAKIYYEIPILDEEKIQSLSNIAIMMVKYLLLENMLTPKTTNSLEQAITYIHENLHRELSIQSISRSAHLSKTTLYAAFHQRFHCTVSSYIHAKRVEKAMQLLSETDLNMEEISQRVGFSSASYFSKIFKKHTGLSPLQQRKRSRKS